MTWQVISSAEDMSVNHVEETDDGGYWESRYVQRDKDYFICYLSSHTGCGHSCRFCHLTATGQTMMKPATIEEYLQQAEQVFSTYRNKLQSFVQVPDRVHFNFMARGEALSNPYFLEHSSMLFAQLGALAAVHELSARFLVSTIFPNGFCQDLAEVLRDDRAVPYYSLYSVEPRFRKRWLPKAQDPLEALAKLKQFQDQTGRDVVLHWAFIAGENDSYESVDATMDAVEQSGLRAKFNLVRYNPHDSRHGVEPNQTRLETIFNHICSRLRAPGSRIVPRVGFDCKASCGMFVER